MPKTFLVGCDGSPASRRAVDFAVKQAKQADAAIVVLHVLEWSPYSFLTPTELEERHKRRGEELERAKEAIIDPVLEAVSSSGVSVSADMRYGRVVETLVDAAKSSGAAQIFIGRTGDSAMASRFFGSVAGSLMQASAVPVTIVP